MELSIVIVNWNAKDYLRKCIASILGETRGVEFEIIVVDSASYDGCEQMLKDCYPHVRFIQIQENVGFAKANNCGFKASTGKYVMFLNPDTELAGPALNTTCSQLQTLPDAGVIGCRLLNSDGSLQTSCIRSFPTLVNEFLDADALRKRFPCSSLWGASALFKASERPVRVDAVSGAFILMRREVFERVGMFTTEYFMYSEDVDLCFKTKKAGLQNYYVDAATVVHHGGGSTAKTSTNTFSSVMMLESRWRFFVNTKSYLYACTYRLGMGLMSAARIALTALLLATSYRKPRAARWSAALEKWRARLRWVIGLESWVRKF